MTTLTLKTELRVTTGNGNRYEAHVEKIGKVTCIITANDGTVSNVYSLPNDFGTCRGLGHESYADVLYNPNTK